nr:unnamed protein product [Digitaria exilis]
MASPAERSSTCHAKIPDFLVGPVGQPMPAVGLGTASHPFVEEEVRASVLTVLELGYRHIDTAALYASERVVGEAMSEAVCCGIVASREELFVTSKVWCTQCHPELVLPSLKKSLRQDTYLSICRNLQMEYVDLYLIHWPMAVKPSKPHFPMKREDIVPMDLSGTWKAMEECHRLGLAKTIGVSNFTTKKLQELLAIANIPPAVNQISLRWIYEQGASMVVKSLNRERLKENIEIFDWELSDGDRLKIGRQIPQRKLITVQNLLCPEGISSVDISDVDVLEI